MLSFPAAYMPYDRCESGWIRKLHTAFAADTLTAVVSAACQAFGTCHTELQYLSRVLCTSQTSFAATHGHEHI